ncbi:IS256 family transposase [bacterium]|nr:IS256 family transposase [bacterium]
MTHHQDDTTIARVMETLIENGMDGMGEAFGILYNAAMEIERAQFLGASRYERSENRIGRANGFKDKTIKARVGKIPLKIPQVRGLPKGVEGFYPKSLEKGIRSERALKLALAEMYIQGVSTRKVTRITEELCGFEISSTDVSRATKLLDEELDLWRNRKLGLIRYLILDARYEKIRHGGSVIDCAVLVAIGVGTDGKRIVLGTSVALSEAEVHWRAFISSLLDRGMRGVQMIASDDHKGLKKALQSTMPSVPWQRCQCHLQRNAQKYVPKVAMRGPVAGQLRQIFTADNRTDADLKLKDFVKKYEKSAPSLADWAEENIPEGLTVFKLPESHRKKMRTTNSIERLNKEIKRRTRVATLFPNEASLLRLVSAVLAEISEEWETGMTYISMRTE